MDSIFFGRQVSKCAIVLRSYAKEKIIKVMNMNIKARCRSERRSSRRRNRSVADATRITWTSTAYQTGADHEDPSWLGPVSAFRYDSSTYYHYRDGMGPGRSVAAYFDFLQLVQHVCLYCQSYTYFSTLWYFVPHLQEKPWFSLFYPTSVLQNEVARERCRCQTWVHQSYVYHHKYWMSDSWFWIFHPRYSASKT